MTPLPRWQCHKIVEAARITQIVWAEGRITLHLDLEGADPVVVTQPWLTAHPAEVGGYYVRYEDGYASYSPAAAFEAGYTLIPADQEALR